MVSLHITVFKMATKGLQFHHLLVVIFATVHLPNLSSCQKQSIDPVVQGKIDDFIQNVYLPAAKISGLGLSVVQNDGEVLYTSGYGLADHDKGIQIGNDTQFLIGSITKSFTAVATIKVLSEKFPELGEAVLNTPIRKLLPQINFTLIDRFRSEQLTFRDLLTHRHCIFTDDMILLSDPFNNTDDLLYRQRYSPQMCGVRSEYQYNNQMYTIAGKLAGQLINQSYEEFVQELLTEIGMVDSKFVSRSDDFSNMPYRAMPYYVVDNISHPINTELIKRVVNFNAAGGLFISPNDMTKYIRFHLNLGSIDGKQVIQESVMRWLPKPVVSLPSFTFKSNNDDLFVNSFSYGLGVVIASYDGWENFHHSGYFPPYISWLSFFPSHNLGVFTSSNQAPVYVDPTAIHVFIFETLRGAENATEKALKVMNYYKTKSEKDKLKNQELVDEFLNKGKKLSTNKQNPIEIIGKYGSGSGGDLEVFEKFNEQTNTTGIYLSYGRWAKGWVEAVGENRYVVTWDTDIRTDDYAAGYRTSVIYAAHDNGTLELYSPGGEELLTRAIFQLGLTLDKLPPIPWSPDSCGLD